MNDDAELLRAYVESASESAFAALVERHKGQVCRPANIQFSPDDMGRIVGHWLDKTYAAQNMDIVVLE